MLDVSVVIGFRDWGLQRLELAISSVKQSFGKHKGEVILSDFGSTDQVKNQNLAVQLGAKYVFTPREEKWSRARALNAGFAVAQGQLLVSTDADMVFSPSSFEKIYDVASSEGFHSAYFLQCRDLPEEMDDNWVAENPDEWAVMESRSRIRPRWGMGGMMAISFDGFEKIHGFDERLHTYGGEDLDFAQRARRAGYRTLWLDDPAIRMYHMWHPPTIAAVSQTAEGTQAVENNRAVVYHDKTFVRNFIKWDYPRPSADPLVTVAICTQNRANLIGETIQSVLNQTVQDFEIVVVDDGGADETKEVLEGFNDDRIRYVWQKGAGISAARNHAALLSKGTFTAVIDDDDLMHPQRLEWHLECLEGGMQGNCGSFVNFDEDTGETQLIVSKIPSLETAMDKGSAPGHSTWFISTDILRKFGYDETITSGVDNNLFLRMLRAGISIGHTGKPVTLRRMHSEQVTVKQGTSQASAATDALAFIQWAVSGGGFKKIAEDLKGAQIYPETPGRPAMLAALRPYLPDGLVNRALVLKWELAPGIAWDGRVTGFNFEDDESLVSRTVITGASYMDMVRARREGLDFAAVAHTVDSRPESMPLASEEVFGAFVEDITNERPLDDDFLVFLPSKVESERSSSDDVWNVTRMPANELSSLNGQAIIVGRKGFREFK